MVIVINFGGQYAHLIARRVRELGVKSELISPNVKSAEIKKINPQAIILSGSPFSVYDSKAPKIDSKIFDLNIPILGICYGMHLIARQLNGNVANYKSKQFGKIKIKITQSNIVSAKIKELNVWFSHGDVVNKMPTGFKKTFSTSTVAIAGFENAKKKIYGIQYHPEVTHTEGGQDIFSNFLFKVAKVKKDWDLKQFKNTIVKSLSVKINNQKVIMAVSGGVDSLVAAALLKEAAPNNLYLIFINTGLLRKNEENEVKKIINSVGFKNFRTINANDQFLNVLKGVTNPEKKRKAISQVYFKIFEKEAQIIKNVTFLAQGTIYPDRIESAQPSAHADKIKSHHNVTLPRGLKLEILEPIAELYKDEVRKLGTMLNLPEEYLARHPFPGPGLAIRVLGEVTEERLSILREVDDIFIKELISHNIYNQAGQALAALLPQKAVGVMGDARTYSYLAALRSVDTVDFMTADWTKFTPEFLEKVSSRIVNEVRGVNRVLYDITQKPPATIEYE